MKFLLGLTAALTVITLVLQIFTFGYFGQFLGFLSLSIEAMLGLPQLYSNWRTQSVKGVSLTMIAIWFLGDFCKTIYFIMKVQRCISLGSALSVHHVRNHPVEHWYFAPDPDAHLRKRILQQFIRVVALMIVNDMMICMIWWYAWYKGKVNWLNAGKCGSLQPGILRLLCPHLIRSCISSNASSKRLAHFLSCFSTYIKRKVLLPLQDLGLGLFS